MFTRSSRHPSLLRIDDTIVMIVDMQEPFLRQMHEGEQLIRNVDKLLDVALTLRLPLLVTQQNTKRLGPTIPSLSDRIPPEYAPFDKVSFSAMADTAIESNLIRSGRKQVVVCGLEAHICISQTVHDLLAKQYQVHVVADATSSRKLSDWEVGINRVERSGAVITSTEMVIFELLGEADTPEFRTMLNVIK